MRVVKEKFLNYRDLYIYQDKDAFCYGIDAVLLGNFIKITPAQKHILDLGTGNLPIPLILYSKYKKNIDCVEIQDSVCELCNKTIIFVFKFFYFFFSIDFNIFNVFIFAVAKGIIYVYAG